MSRLFALLRNQPPRLGPGSAHYAKCVWAIYRLPVEQLSGLFLVSTATCRYALVTAMFESPALSLVA